MNKRDVYKQGKDTGYDIAAENASSYDLSIESERERFVSEIAEYESDGYRQYTPFEFFAHDINACGDRADGLWDAYDDGVLAGIYACLKDELKALKESSRNWTGIKRELNRNRTGN